MCLATVHGDFVLRCAEAKDMASLIEDNLRGLKARSVFALAQQDAGKPGKAIQWLNITQEGHLDESAFDRFDALISK